MRNPSKNTIKKLMRPFGGIAPGHAWLRSNYRFVNRIGQRVYYMSKGKIDNIEPKGYKRYLTKAHRDDIIYERDYLPFLTESEVIIKPFVVPQRPDMACETCKKVMDIDDIRNMSPADTIRNCINCKGISK